MKGQRAGESPQPPSILGGTGGKVIKQEDLATQTPFENDLLSSQKRRSQHQASPFQQVCTERRQTW